MKLKKMYYYYKATFPGEIKVKIKRKILMRFKKENKRYEQNINNLKLNSIFFRENKVLFNRESQNVYRIFNKEINILENVDWDILNKDKDKEWYKIKIKDYKDIKYTWEINRLQFILPLVLNKNEKRAIELLDDWIKNNKYNKGPNWNSNLELAIRVISILNTVIAINRREIYEKYKKIIYLHGAHLYEEIFYTEKCIPNNHVVGEAAALYCISKFIIGDESLKWEVKAKEILKKYLNHIRDDGTYLEGSLSYHRFYLQMYIMVYIYLIKTKDEFIKNEIEEILKKSYIFFNSIKKPNNSYPDFGDNDEGFFYKTCEETNFFNFVESLRYFFYKKDFNKNEIKELEKIYNIKLFINNFIDKNDMIFSEGKFAVIKKEKNYILMNNQEQIYHSHSDGLSIELVLDGQSILTDSGTFNYNIDREKRRYYRGTKSHNTVYLGEDQSLQIGSFRWINISINKLEIEKKKKIKLLGNIKTKSQKEHYRTIICENNFNIIEIEDIIINTESIELNWHFDEKIELIKIKNNMYDIKQSNYKIIIEYDFQGEIILGKSVCSKKYGEEFLRLNLKLNNFEKKKIYKINTKLIRKDKK